MAAQQLPMQPSVPFYRFGTTIDGIAYLVDVRWNARSGDTGAWFLDLLTEDETQIRVGMKLVQGTMIGGRSALEGFPDGSLSAVDLTGQDVDAFFDDMGVRVMIWFITAEDD